MNKIISKKYTFKNFKYFKTKTFILHLLEFLNQNIIHRTIAVRRFMAKLMQFTDFFFHSEMRMLIYFYSKCLNIILT